MATVATVHGRQLLLQPTNELKSTAQPAMVVLSFLCCVAISAPCRADETARLELAVDLDQGPVETPVQDRKQPFPPAFFRALTASHSTSPAPASCLTPPLGARSARRLLLRIIAPATRQCCRRQPERRSVGVHFHILRSVADWTGGCLARACVGNRISRSSTIAPPPKGNPLLIGLRLSTYARTFCRASRQQQPHLLVPPAHT